MISKNYDQLFQSEKLNKIFFLFLLSFIFSLPVESQQNDELWTENWEEDWQERWLTVGQGLDCSYSENGNLIQECQSAAIQSIERFPTNQQIEFSGTLFSEPAAGSSTENNLAHHTLFGIDDGPNGQYCGLYLHFDPPSGRDQFFHISYPTIEFLGDVEHDVHSVKIVWQPFNADSSGTHGRCKYYIDDKLWFVQGYTFTVSEISAWIGTNSVDPGQGDDGSSSYALHGPLSVVTESR